MKYFWIETDTRNHIPYGINAERKIDIRDVNRRNAYRIPNCCIIDMKVPDEVFFADMLLDPLMLVSEPFVDALEVYAPGTVFKTVYLLHKESGIHRTYFMPFLEEVDCLDESTAKTGRGTVLKEIVLKKEAVGDRSVFRIAGYMTQYVIGRVDFVEGILRRHVRGIKLKEVEAV